MAGKQVNEKEKPAAAAAAPVAKGKKPAAGTPLLNAWKKLNSMDRRQAYTWGAVALVGLVALLTLGSAMGSSSDYEDFSDFQTRGYDLANMPFSSDEAEEYLLASKYPDMKNSGAAGLYSEEEKAERQAEDAEAAAEAADALSGGSAADDSYRPGRYYGGGAGGVGGTRTNVGSLNSANLKSAGGSGISGTFGPRGDFSNFRSQDKGSDKAPVNAGSGNARKALFQTAKGSRAAAGLKNDKLLNAKKAMIGGDVKGSNAFLDDSGAVNLGAAKGLELDTNAPISSADLSGLQDKIADANKNAAQEKQDEEEMEWWQEMLIDVAKQIAQGIVSMGMNMAQNAVDTAMQNRQNEKQADQMAFRQADAQIAAQQNQIQLNSNGQVDPATSFQNVDFNSMDDDTLSSFNLTRGANNEIRHNETVLGTYNEQGVFTPAENVDAYDPEMSTRKWNKANDKSRDAYVRGSSAYKDSYVEYYDNLSMNSSYQRGRDRDPQILKDSSGREYIYRNGKKVYLEAEE